MIAAILPDTFTAASHCLEHKSAPSTFIEWQKKKKKKKKDRPMEEDRKPGDKPIHLWASYL